MLFALMRKVAARDIFWNALLHTSVGEVQMLSEEEGIDKNGFIPESERLKIAKGRWMGRRGMGKYDL